MHRRHLLAAATAAALIRPAAAASVLPVLGDLPKTPAMPVLFVGHGSPMNAIEDNAWRREWQAVGRRFGTEYPRPRLILCVSAHWITQGWWITGAQRPPTLHDFGGFPRALYQQQYPAPGAPAVASGLAGHLRRRQLQLDAKAWGYDHGTWSVLKPMFPQADIPVLQLSLDYSRHPEVHFELARELGFLRQRGVLIVGSGNVVHNLRAVRREARPDQAYDWAYGFDEWAAPLMEKADGRALAAFLRLGDLARLAHPSHDHMLPLLHAVAAVAPGERARTFNTGFQSGSISMRSILWG